jgi:hypothetical protein
MYINRMMLEEAKNEIYNLSKNVVLNVNDEDSKNLLDKLKKSG